MRDQRISAAVIRTSASQRDGVEKGTQHLLRNSSPVAGSTPPPAYGTMYLVRSLSQTLLRDLDAEVYKTRHVTGGVVPPVSKWLGVWVGGIENIRYDFLRNCRRDCRNQKEVSLLLRFNYLC